VTPAREDPTGRHVAACFASPAGTCKYVEGGIQVYEGTGHNGARAHLRIGNSVRSMPKWASSSVKELQVQ
jgi:hypothetical protein